MSDLITKVRTPLFRASYAFVWEPRAGKPGRDGKPKPPKYGVCMLFPKASTNIEALSTAAMNAAINKWGADRARSMFESRAETGFKWPIRDGDSRVAINPEKYAIYKGMIFINSSNKDQPGIVELTVDKQLQRIIDPKQFYSGCWAVATVNFSAYDVDGGLGVGCYVNNLCKMKDDDRLSGNADAEEDFADFATQAPAASQSSFLA